MHRQLARPSCPPANLPYRQSPRLSRVYRRVNHPRPRRAARLQYRLGLRGLQARADRRARPSHSSLASAWNPAFRPSQAEARFHRNPQGRPRAARRAGVSLPREVLSQVRARRHPSARLPASVSSRASIRIPGLETTVQLPYKVINQNHLMSLPMTNPHMADQCKSARLLRLETMENAQ